MQARRRKNLRKTQINQIGKGNERPKEEEKGCTEKGKGDDKQPKRIKTKTTIRNDVMNNKGMHACVRVEAYMGVCGWVW